MKTNDKRVFLMATCILAACSAAQSDLNAPITLADATPGLPNAIATGPTGGSPAVVVPTGGAASDTGAPNQTPTDASIANDTSTILPTLFDGAADDDMGDGALPNQTTDTDNNMADTEGTTTPGGVPVPKIPEPSGECPSFQSGIINVMGMSFTINAGTPGPIKGAMIFGFHGTGGMGSGNVPLSVQTEVTGEGGIIAIPRMAGGTTDIAPPTSTWYVSNMEIVDLMVACAVKNHNIDPNRIHATGCSAGGLMSGSLGLMRSEYMASVAPNSGGINFAGSRHLSDTSHAPHAFLMNGGSVDNVIVNFGQTSEWFAIEALKATTKPYVLNCNHGIGHCMAPVSLHEMAWEFMKAHPFNVVESPWKTSPPANLPTYCQVME